MSDQEFSAQDLALLNTGDANADEATSNQNVASKEENKGSQNPESEATSNQAHEEKKPAQTLVEDDLDEEGDPEPARGKDEEDKKPEAKQPTAEEDPKWRDKIADRILGKAKGLKPEQVDKRRQAIMNRLGRYASLWDYTIAGFAAQEKIASGEYRAKPPEGASEEELNAWRAEAGIPLNAKEYDVPKVPGYKWTDNDKPLIDNFKDFAHKANYTQDQVNAGAEWYVKTVQDAQEKYWETLASTDAQDKESAKDELRAEYGPADYKTSIKALDRLLNDPEVMPNGLGQQILTSRYIDEKGESKRLINNPHMARILINYAGDTYGVGSFVTGDAKTNASNRKSEIEKVMTEDYDRYWRDGLADEYEQILKQEEESSTRRGRRAA